MEYLEGEDLEQRVKRRGPLPVDEVVDFITQACEAIAEAHALGIIHRDLKLSNLFVTRRPDGSERIKVIDFGIAKVVGPDASESSMTRTLEVMGSPTYMSPEQLNSTRNVDVRTDVWALGVILYEMLTARAPFEAKEMLELYMKIASSPPPPLDRPTPRRGSKQSSCGPWKSRGTSAIRAWLTSRPRWPRLARGAPRKRPNGC
jgi:serine/threonine-protein kinase